MEPMLSVTSLNQNSNSLTTNLPSSAGNLLAKAGELLASNSSSSTGSTLFGRSSSPFSAGSSALGGNVIIGDGKWVATGIDQNIVSLLAENTVSNFTNIIFDRLEAKYVSEGGDKLTGGSTVTNENPFANGNNPFGEGNFPSLPALDILKSQYGENFPLPSGDATNFGTGGSGSPFGGSNTVTDGSSDIGLAGGDNPVTGDGSDNLFVSENNPVTDSIAIAGENTLTSGGSGNPFAGGGSENSFAGGGSGNPFAGGGSGNPFSGDISKLIIGDVSGNLSTKDTLSGVLDKISNFSDSLSSMSSIGGTDSNESPFETPSDLLRLFRSGMASFGLTVDSFTNVTGENNPFAGSSNPFAGTNPFASGNTEQDSQLFKFLGWALDGLLPFTGRPNVFQTPEGELPLGYGNRDFGSGNATIGNANRDYGSNNGSIGNNNWNWDWATNNASIGNGNFNFGSYNKTVGNGNWSLDNSSDNKTLGNGNWNIGSDNSTLGNGNFNFGSNNLVIGDGNWVFTSNSIVIGNGNWSVVMENTPTNLASVSSIVEKMETLAIGSEIKTVVDNLVDTAVKKMGSAFYGLTTDFDDSQLSTFDKVIRAEDSDTHSSFSFSYSA